jgi:integrase
VGEGDRRLADGWLFTHGDGRHWSPSHVTHTFRRLVREADLPPIRFHDLRHGAASLSLAAGSDLKSVQAMLGHESIVLTADTYTSVLRFPRKLGGLITWLRLGTQG